MTIDLTIRMVIASDWGFPVGAGLRGFPGPPSLRGQVALRLLPHLALLVGLGVNGALATGGRDADVGFGLLEVTSRSGDVALRVYPGFVLGLQI